MPLSPTTTDEDEISKALLELDNLPKPILVHCGLGARAGAIAIISTAINHDWTLEPLTANANALGVPLDQPDLKQFIQKTCSHECGSVESSRHTVTAAVIKNGKIQSLLC